MDEFLSDFESGVKTLAHGGLFFIPVHPMAPKSISTLSTKPKGLYKKYFYYRCKSHANCLYCLIIKNSMGYNYPDQHNPGVDK
jgi:hypothetical protein